MPSFLELQEKYANELAKLIDTLSKDTIEDRKTLEYIEEYDGERLRRSKSVGKRENKTVDTYTENTDTGEVVKSGSKTVIVSKLSLPFPRKIVRTRNHFLFGGKMTVSGPEGTDALSEFKRIWIRELKMQNVLKSLARTCMVETKAAVVFYPQKTRVDNKEVLKLRSTLLNKSKGEFFPHFDDYGDMDAFIYRYVNEIDGKKVENAKIYTAETIYTYSKAGGAWSPAEFEPSVKNEFGKIPVVYVEQDEPEWECVTSMIDNFEMRISRLADTNDYFAEPLLKLFGSVKRAPGKDEVGKMLEFAMTEGPDGKPSHGDAEYATWDHTPESIKLDLETSWGSIFSMTSTPDLSFNNIKGIGNVSGVAMELMFMDAFIAKEEAMEIFDPALKRCVSIVVAGMENYTKIKFSGDISLDDIEVSFTATLPQDIKNLIETIFTATGGKPILSQETASAISPLTLNVEEEFARIKAEGEIVINEPFNM